MVWQPRFAYTAAIVIAASLTVVSLPLWMVLFRTARHATGDRRSAT